MCQFCDELRKRNAPPQGLTKACLLAGKCGTEKPICLLVHNAYDAEDNATKYKSDVTHVDKTRGHQLLNKKRITIAGCNLTECLTPKYLGNGPLYMSFQSHGAPGWTLGEDGTLLSELRAIEKLLELKCEVQLKTNRPIEAIVLRSCYSAVECYHNGRFLISSARLVSILIPGVLVVGFLGSDNGGTKVTGLCDNRMLSLVEGTVSFFNGLVVEATESANIDAPVKPVATRNELQRLCLFAPHRLPLLLIPGHELPKMIVLMKDTRYFGALKDKARLGRARNARPPRRVAEHESEESLDM